MLARGSLAACFLAVLWSLLFCGHLPSASAHVTFKLPSLPGVSPGNAGGYGAQNAAPRGSRSRARAAG